MAAGNTFTPIYNIANLASIYSLKLDNIPSTYTDLFILLEYTGERDGEVVVRFNNDSGSNYGYTYFRSNQNSASGIVGKSQSQAGGVIDLNGGWRGTTTTLWIPRYADTGKNKMYLSKAGGWESTSYTYTSIHGGTWKSTAAINSITFMWNGSKQFSEGVSYGLRVNIYGVAEA